MNLTIGVLYSCHRCGVQDIEVQVPARETEDVRDWMKATTFLLGNDHERRSPHCKTDTLDDVKVPMAGADRVGGAPVQ